MIGETVLHYKIISELGAGGMGVVYKAEDTKLGRIVALKFLPPELSRDKTARARLMQEAQSISRLQHNNICAIHEINETGDGRLFLCMDYYEGETLKERLARGPVPVQEAVNLITEVCDGLDFAHRRGIVHRDVKPANIILTADGTAKILDFGLAMAVDSTRITQAGTTVGTIAYMAPEQIRDETVDNRTDIFSLGTVLYEMLTGVHPFSANVDSAIGYRIQNEEPASLKGPSAKFNPILGRMLAKEPEQRYASAGEVSRALASTGERATGRKHGSRRSNAALMIGIGLVIVAATIVLFNRRHDVKAAEPKLAILYFENVTDQADSQRFGEITTNLLITGLSESKYVKVVSSQRIYDILKNLGKEGAKVVGRDVATRVAQEAGANQMLLGSIVRANNRVELASQLVDVGTGDLVASQSVRANADEDIFSLVDRLATAVKKDLALPASARNEPISSLAAITTSSADAYRFYLEGSECFTRVDWACAIGSFRKSVEIDSTFARGWLSLADPWLRNVGVSTAEASAAIKAAQRHSDKLSDGERKLLQARARVLAGDSAGGVAILEGLVQQAPDDDKTPYYDLDLLTRGTDPYKSIAWLQKVLAIDPQDRKAYNALTYEYDIVGDMDRSLWAINKYIELAPKDANAFDTRADLYQRHGEVDKALESYRYAVTVDSTFALTWLKLGEIYALKGDESRSADCWNRALKTGNAYYASGARCLMALEPLLKGHRNVAIKKLRMAIATDIEAKYNGWYLAAKWFHLGCLFVEQQSWSASDSAFAQIAPEFKDDQWFCAFRIALVAGIDPRRAERLMSTLPKGNVKSGGSGLVNRELRDISQSWIYLGSRDYAEACKVIDSASSTTLVISKNYTKGMAYLGAERYGDACLAFQSATASPLDSDLIMTFPTWIVKGHYYLGRAYEANKQADKAAAEYQAFVNRWSTADKIFLDDVDDARLRLKRLRT